VQYIQSRGPEAFRRFLGQLTPDTRARVEEGFLFDGWYPFEQYIEISKVLDRQLGTGDLQLCRDLGRYACDVNLPTLYRVFFRFGSVSFILRRAAAAWTIHYDEGQMLITAQGDDWVQLRMVGVPNPHRALCLSVLGWMVRACELSGGEVYDEHETCRARGEQNCEFHFKWRA
jgi:hypothetical protein